MPAQCGLWRLQVAAGVKGFIESSLLDWPGQVSAVVFLPGCNFRCPFCHNPELVLRPGTLVDISLDEILTSIESHRGWLDGIVVTGGEPTAFYGIEGLLTQLKEAGLEIKLDTNGSRPDLLRRLIGNGLVDAVAMDVKAPLTVEAYSSAAGVLVDISIIKDSIALLADSGLDVVFRATVVPGLHDEAAVRAMKDALHGRGLTLQNFMPDNVLDPGYRLKRPFTELEFERLVNNISPLP